MKNDVEGSDPPVTTILAAGSVIRSGNAPSPVHQLIDSRAAGRDRAGRAESLGERVSVVNACAGTRLATGNAAEVRMFSTSCPALARIPTGVLTRDTGARAAGAGAYLRSLRSRSRRLGAEPRVRLPSRCAARYGLLRPIGRGGYGTVWLAWDRQLEREVALKVLYGRAAADPAAVERFQNEAAVTARLSSPHIVRLWEHGLEDGIPWIAFEYLGETSLGALLEAHGRLAPDVALDAVGQVAAALEEAHAHGVLHRDLKPDNVIAERPGFYKLIDFGVAGGQRSGRFRTDVNFIMGTPAYLAPEQVRCLPASGLTDQYQLGLLAHHLMCGTVPHFERHLPRMLGRRSSETVESLRLTEPAVPEAVDAVVRRMLEPDPAARFTSVAEARAALEGARGGAMPEAAPRRKPTLNLRLDSAKIVRSTRLAPALRVVECEPRRACPEGGGRGPRRWLWLAAGLAFSVAAAVAVRFAVPEILRYF